MRKISKKFIRFHRMIMGKDLGEITVSLPPQCHVVVHVNQLATETIREETGDKKGKIPHLFKTFHSLPKLRR